MAGLSERDVHTLDDGWDTEIEIGEIPRIVLRLYPER